MEERKAKVEVEGLCWTEYVGKESEWGYDV